MERPEADNFTRLVEQLRAFGDTDQSQIEFDILFRHFQVETLALLNVGVGPYCVVLNRNAHNAPKLEAISESDLKKIINARRKSDYIWQNHAFAFSELPAMKAITKISNFSQNEFSVGKSVLVRTVDGFGDEVFSCFFRRRSCTIDRKILAELGYLSPFLHGPFLSRGHQPRATKLSLRQTECLSLVAAGKTSQEISSLLGLSNHTVNNYLVTAMKKLGASTRHQAVATAIKTGRI